MVFASFIILVYLIGLSGSVFTDAGAWYQGLRKPFFTPPGWVISAVWNVLFLLIGLSGGFMYFQSERRSYFIFYGVNLALNFLWSPIFFWLKNPALAFIELVFLWMTILALIFLALKRSRVAAYLLIPYLVWVSIAGVLNFSIAFVA
ncbi:MAG: TspO/MBR family protein [Candidatus Bathyarchaeia archaeon]